MASQVFLRASLESISADFVWGEVQTCSRIRLGQVCLTEEVKMIMKLILNLQMKMVLAVVV